MLKRLSIKSYSTGYITGLASEMVTGFGLAYFKLGLISIAGEIRCDRLLLAYHDRLREAGLLPGEPVETMEADPTTPRS